MPNYFKKTKYILNRKITLYTSLNSDESFSEYDGINSSHRSFRFH